MLYNRRGVSDYALYDEAGIFERTGVTPAQYVDYAALRGDPSDNLPGVPGVGEKTAAKLINTYGGLDGIFANVDKQTPKLRESLDRATRRGPRSNTELMILRRDAPDRVSTSTTLTVEPDQAEVRRLFDFLEFRSLHDRLYEALGIQGTAPPPSSTSEVLHAEVTELHVGGRGRDAARRARRRLDLAAGVGRRARPQRARRPRGRRRRGRRRGAVARPEASCATRRVLARARRAPARPRPQRRRR